MRKAIPKKRNLIEVAVISPNSQNKCTHRSEKPDKNFLVSVPRQLVDRLASA